MTSVFTQNQKSWTQGPQQGQPVILLSNRNDEALETNVRKPCLVTVEDPDSVQLLIDSKDRINVTDDPFRFTCDLTTNMYRARSCRVTKAIVPKIPNVTVNNNQIVIKHDLGTTATFTIQPAFYNTTSLSNALTAAINAAFAAVPIADTVVTSFDPTTRTFSITSTGAHNFFISDQCTFITRGEFLAPFESEPIANVPSKAVIYSGPAAMVYSRYITVHSPTLNQYSFGNTLTTSFSQQSDIICILDVSNIDDPDDYDPTKAFAGIYKSIEVTGAPQINICCPQKNLHNVHNFFVLDEYGLPLQDIMNLGGVYPANKLGITIYFEVKF